MTDEMMNLRALVEKTPDADILREMSAFCRHGLPAVRVVGKQLLALGIKPADDETKKMIGRWIREIMERQGWTTWRPGKVPRGNLFSTGMIYRPRELSK